MIIHLPYFETTRIGEARLESMFDSGEKQKLSINKEKCANLIDLIPNYVEVIDLA